MCWVGIDVSQQTLDVVVWDGQRHAHWQVANTPSGIGELVQMVQQHPCEQIALEPTGPYHLPVAEALVEAELPAGMVGPGELHAYRRAVNIRNKTDAADAALLAEYAQLRSQAIHPLVTVPPAQRRLRALVRYRDQLVRQRVRVNQQQRAAQWEGCADVLEWQAEDLAQLRARERAVTAEIRTQLAAFPEAAVVLAMPGVGPITAASVLAYLPRELWGDAKKAAAYAGLVPELRISGKQTRSHLSRRGHRRLRHALYNAAGTAGRWDDDLAAYRAHLLATGKPRKSVRCALAHRLMRHMMGRLRAFSAQQAPLAA